MSLIKSIEESYNRIAPYINHTPLTFSHKLSEISGANVYLKCEHLQKTGSFKFRGALSKILSLPNKDQEIIAASTGNHGQGVALAASLSSLKATIFVPKTASKLKIDAIKSFGASVEFVDGNCLHAETHAKKLALKKKAVFVSPYNDSDVISGQGTIAVEIKQDKVQPDAVFISVGGGGLISGVGSYIKHYYPNAKIMGCWAKNAPAMYKCLEAGKIIPVKELETISDATKGEPEPGTITLDICKDIIDESFLVTESEIYNSMRLIAEYERWIVEGSAGVALAAFLQNTENFKGKNVVILLCGRNIIFDKFLKATNQEKPQEKKSAI